MSWSASQYLKFGGERTRPCRDLAARIEFEPRSVIDLGCGPGNSTAVLAERWPEAAITGLDSSANMLDTARRDQPSLRWIEGDITSWDGPDYDLVFSNAALQWVDNHAEVFARLLAHARVLAVQVPAVSNQPGQRAIRDLATNFRGRFTRRIHDWYSEEPAFYYDVLARRAARLDIWQTEYLHILDGPEGVVEWYRATGLRPFLDALPQADRDEFLAEYLSAVTAAYPRRPDGRVLFPFLRTFVIAYAP